ncbi:MAG TPA: hypothetical protein VNY51_00910 [Candidatus Dormibacteraeota bacterium]|nr:hypothetical protein [Candidatus Dormibacteraeota bacterium]
MKHTKEHQKEKQWWLSLAYALGRLRVRSLALLEKTQGFGMTDGEKCTLLFQTDPYRFLDVERLSMITL